jgi:gamma-glutamyltranspeptidase/glutathione hydrolase
MSQAARGAIAAGHPCTAAAGVEMLRQGGNAFDAVAAAVLTACVAEPGLTSLAGGGFLLAHTPGRNVLFDFFTQTPRQKRPIEEVDFYPVIVNFGEALQEFHIGLGAIAVPGTIGGIYHVQQTLGRLPFAVVTEPAIHYARTGVEVNPFQAYCVQILEPILLRDPAMKQVYAPTGTLVRAGDRITMTDFANTLEHLARVGVGDFYHGELAHQLVDDCRLRGGYLTLEDLANYQVIERSPLSVQYRGQTFITNPPPSSGGALIGFSLALLNSVDLSTLSPGSLEHVRLLAAVMRLTNQARADGYDRRLYDPDVAQQFLAPDHLTAYAQHLPTPVNKWGSTTHVSVIDGEGNAASVTSSNGEGCGYAIPGTGVMVNNMLGEADLHPHGFHNWTEQVRISSMMAPTMVLDGDRPAIVLGSGGSNRIRTAILQVISNRVDFGMDLDTAVHFPRIHWEDGMMNLEPGLDLAMATDQFPFDQGVLPWEQQNMFFGGVHAVMRGRNGMLDGVGDRRRGGAVALA